MERYIVVAPASQGSLLGSFRGKGAWEEESQARAKEGSHQRLAEYLERTSDVALKAPADALNVVGATIVEMEENEMGELCKQHPKATVVKDRSLFLVSPTMTDQVDDTAPNRWHLETLGIEQAQTEGKIGKGAGIRIALIDSGVDASHPEFAGRTVEQAVVADDDIELVAPEDGDTDGHGTHTAGLAGGATVGVAPEADLLSLRAMENRSVQLSDLLVRWVRYIVQRRDVDVVNLSIGLPISQFDQEPAAVVAMEAAFGLLRRNDILTVVAIGNDGRNRVRYPGALPETLAVGATTRANKIWSSSSSGSVSTGGVTVSLPDLVAPGAGVYSSVPGSAYRPAWGTSQAAPLVAGVAALLRERDETLTAEDLQDALLTNCNPLANAMPDRQGAGILAL